MRRRWIGPALGLAAGLACLPLPRSSLFRGFEQRTVDARMLLRGAAAAAPEVAVCAIDARSVDRLGQWPWPRSLVAELISRLHAAGARAIALDMIFSEPSRLGAAEDEALARALRASGNTVLGFYLTAEPAEGPVPPVLPLPIELAVTPPAGFPALPAYPGIETNIESLTRAAPAGGHFVIQPDDDGTIRHYSLILSYRGELYPSLALRAAQVYLGSSPIAVHPHQGRLPLVSLGSLEVPTSERGELWINFRGPFGRTFPYYSAVDLLDGALASEAFAGKLVFIGATETGIGDITTSPFDVTVPGVEVHATVADNLLHQRFLRDGAPEAALGGLAILLVGLACGWAAVSFSRAIVGVAVAAAALALYAALTQLALVALARHLDLFVPVLAGALGYTMAAVWRNVFAEAKARQIRSTFARFVSESVVEEMLRDPDKVRLGGEKREMTVLFSDIRGFTALSERLGPEEVVALLNAYLTPMTRIILDQGGTLDKYMGDAIMAFFGAPVQMADHPERACAAALAMKARMGELGADWSRRGLPPLASGIGINTGPMSVGNMGSDMIFDYTVIGDHVNLGSRLEGLTRLYGVDIVTSEYTAERAHGNFCFRELDTVRVKGKQQPVRVYELFGRTEAAATDGKFLEVFAAALAAYRAGAFVEAAAHVAELARLRPDDGPTAYYARRLETLRALPPPAVWDGVTNLVEK